MPAREIQGWIHCIHQGILNRTIGAATLATHGKLQYLHSAETAVACCWELTGHAAECIAGHTVILDLGD